ncbi:megakaryocyte and platelet inhibitory receptor G6b isoform X2 [Monodelphis domestica]|uniref:megakaryocyte and platelet inhibitory receptor G6b isoform X2 n=1 Tax=Monodelphis domestica TaxID=13616 RepID=UPI0024E257BA|nr:megakaryocyte and platelet inhibitory receptor G6b isoform X2 [Monodelphis domestica]
MDPKGIQQLELLLARGDSGTFYCTGIGGRRVFESRTSLKVFGDSTACGPTVPTSGSSYTLLLIPLSKPTGTIPVYGENSPSPQSSALPPSPPTKTPPVNTETQSLSKEEPRERGESDVERNLLYADLDHIPLRNPRWLRTTVPKETATIYAVVV